MELEFFKTDVLPTEDGPYLLEFKPIYNEDVRCWDVGFWEEREKLFSEYDGGLIKLENVLQWAKLPW